MVTAWELMWPVVSETVFASVAFRESQDSNQLPVATNGLRNWEVWAPVMPILLMWFTPTHTSSVLAPLRLSAMPIFIPTAATGNMVVSGTRNTIPWVNIYSMTPSSIPYYFFIYSVHCSHGRSTHYFIESILAGPTKFLSSRCPSYLKFNLGICGGCQDPLDRHNFVSMGEFANPT